MAPPRLSTLTFALLCAFAGAAMANPTGATVVTGKAEVSTSGKTLTVTNTPGTIINWQGFSIAPDELTRFIQQSSSSAILNRVVGQDPSSLLGRLQSNGRVFLINPNGIVFGAGARIDVGGLVASTLDIGDADFLAGRLRFAGPSSAGALTQLGQINTAAGGQVLLIAPRVENAGVITSPQGEILLAAGTSVQLADTANPALRVTVSAPAGEALNLGKLIAEGGKIGIHAGLVGQSGTLSADRAEVGPAGEIYLKGSDGVTLASTSRISAGGAAGGQVTIDAGNAALRAAGTIDAAGSSAGGGSIRLLGRDIQVADVKADASGATGGGEILVGGDYQGGNAALANARTSEVSAGTTLTADARERGRGGKVIVWSDDSTRFAGTISARGGAQGGDGGLVEVSGKQSLAFDGTVDTRAPLGATGTLLLDPSDITISTGANAAVSAGPTFTGSAASSTLNTTTLQTALATNNVVVDTTSAFASAGNISVNNAVTWASGNSLELRAHNNITVAAGATINATGTGALRLVANQDAAGGGDISINAALTAHSGGIAISGANITSAAAGSLTTTGLGNADAGAVSITGTGAVSLAGTITASGGVSPPGPAVPGHAGGAVSISGTTLATGTITASGSAGSGADMSGGNGGHVTLVSNGTIATLALNSSITANGGAGGTGNASGGNAGTISVGNLSTTSGNVATGALTAQSGNATGSGTAGTAGSVTVASANATAGASLATGSINVSGGNKGAGGMVAVTSASNVSLGGTVQASGGGAATGGTHAGASGGSISVTGVDRSVTGAITASGGIGGGVNQAGGNAGSVSLTGSGTLSTAAITTSTGAATGTGAGGTPGSIALQGTTVTAAALSTAGGANGAGGSITATASAGLLNLTGALVSSGGTANASSPGSAAGNVTLSGVNVTTLALTANGSGGATLLSNQPGGAGGSIAITSTGGVTTGAIGASGGAAQTTNGAGGNAGTIAIVNSGAGNVATTTLTASTGAATGTGAGGASGSISVGNTAGDLQAGSMSTAGGASGNGGNIALSVAGNIVTTSGSTFNTSGGAPAAGASKQGSDAGNLTITGGSLTMVAPAGSIAISASGGNAQTLVNARGGHAGTISVTTTAGGANFNGGINAIGGNAAAGIAMGGATGNFIVTAAGDVSTAGTTNVSSGNSIGTGAAGGPAGTISITGANVTLGTITNPPGTNGDGTAITVQATGAITTGAISNAGGAGSAGTAGGSAGIVSLMSTGGPVTTGAISNSGGAGGAGSGSAGGNGAAITIRGVGAISTGALAASGGSAGGTTASGGGAGAIVVANTSAAGGSVTTGALTARAGVSTGAALSGAAGSVTVTESSAALLQTGAISTSGQAGGHGGDVSLVSAGDISVTNGIAASGGTLGAGLAVSGRNAGNVTIRGVNRQVGDLINASGGAAVVSGQAGGNAGAVLLTGSAGSAATAGTLSTASITASSGGGGGTGSGGAAGSITLRATTVSNTGALTTTGGANGDGGAIDAVASSGILNIGGAITTSGGTANASSPGRNAGNVTLAGVGVATLGITASGSAGATALSSQPGGAGGAVQIASTNGVTTAAVTASGGAATTSNADGGNAGSITIANSVGGNVVTTALTASNGAATGTGAGGDAGAISVSNGAGNLQTASISTAGAANGNGGDIVLSASGNVTTTAASTIVSSGGAPAAGASMQGSDAGSITISGASITMTSPGAAGITANGGAALGLVNARGGKAGAIAVTANAGAINVGTLNALGGNAVAGVGAGGAASNLTLLASGDVSTGAIALRSGSAFGSGGSGGAAGTLAVTGANVTLGTITTTGGLDGNGSTVTVNAAGTLTTGAITANGGAGNAGTSGGNAGAVSLTSNGTLSTGGLTASGGTGGAGTGAGGSGGTLSVTNTSTTTGTVTTGALSAQTGAATGATVSGAHGSISASNHAPTLLQVGAIATFGAIGGAGGDVSLTSAGNITSGVISAYGGALNAGTAAAGRAGGSVTLAGVDRNIPSVTTFGAAAVVSGFGGGSGGAVVLTGPDGTPGTAGLLSVPSGITTFSGSAVGPGPGGAAGNVRAEGTTVSLGGISAMGIGNGTGGSVVATASSGALTITGAVNTFGSGGNAGSPGGAAGTATLQGQSVTTGQITSFGGDGNGAGQAGGAGGAVSVLASGGNISVGAIYAYGGNGVAGNASGGDGGAITLDAPGAGHTITIGGSTVMSSGGSRAGTGTAGAGAAIDVKNDALLATSPITFLASGATGGDIHFYGTLDSSGAARSLTTTSNGFTTFDGAIGASSPLAALTSSSGGSVVVNGGSVLSTGAQTFGSPVTLGADAVFNAGAAALAFNTTIDGAHQLTASTTGALTFGAAVGAVTPLTRLVGTAQTLTIAAATIDGGASSAISLTGTRSIVATGALASHGAPITLAGNGAGTSTGTFVGVALTAASLDAGGGDIAITGVGGTVGANDHGIQLADSSLRTIGSGAITLDGTGGGTSGRGVTIANPGAAQVIASVDGDIRISGTASGPVRDTVYSGYGDASLTTTGLGTVTLRALGTGDANGLAIGTTGTALDYYGSAPSQWQLSTASNLVFTGLGITKTTGGDSTWTIRAPKSVIFTGAAGVNATSGKLNLVFNADSDADHSGYVSLAAGTFNTHGGNITIGGGTDPGTGFAWGNSAGPIGINLIGTTLDAGGGDIAMHGHGWSNPAGSHGIYTQGGTTIQTGGNGSISLVGVGGDQVTATQSTGVLLNQVTRVFAQDGDITITGTGGNNTNGSFGVYLDNFQNGTYGGTQVVSSGTGRIDITGTGGNTATAGGNIGFVINFNALVQGAYGDITITGNGGSSSGTRNDGISWNSSGTILSTGTGPNAARINVTGNAGSGSANTFGMTINADKVIAGTNSFATACAVACNGPTISSIDGDISIRGVGSTGTGTGNSGINILNTYGAAGAAPVQVVGLGSASVSVTGIGGSGSAGASNGLQMLSGASTGGLDIRTAGAGNVTLVGVPGAGGHGISVAGPSTVQSTGTGSVTLLVDSIALGAANTIASVDALTIAPFTSGTTLGVGSAATGALALSDAALANLTWGSLLTLGGASAGATTIDSGFAFANPLAVVSGNGADITLAAPLLSTSSATGPTLTLSAGRNFLNTAGAAALDPGAGVWRVYSTTPTADSRGGLVADFKQYDASYATTTVLGSGNGTLYRIAPVLTPVLGGSVTKVYDGNTTAILASGSVVATGTIDGDSATLAAGAASFDTRHAGSGKLVSAPVTLTGASNGAIPVYGYTLSAGSVAAPIGTITPASLTLAAASDSKVYDGSTASTVAPGIFGLVGGDTVSALAQAFDSRNAGARSLVVTGYTVNDGNGGADYSVATSSAAGLITPATLTLGAAADRKVYDGSTASSAAPVVVSGLVAGDSVSGLTQVFDSRNAGARNLTVTGYSVSDGNGGANYVVATNSAAGAIDRAPLTLRAAPDTRVYDGSTVSTARPTVTGLVVGDSVSPLSQAFDSRNAGTRSLTVNGGYSVNDGNGGANYTVATVAAPGIIDRATLTLGAVADTKGYDGNAASAGVPLVVSGLVAGDSVGALSQSFDSRNAGARSIGVSGYAVGDGNGGANYNVITTTAAGTIVAAPLTIVADDKSRTTIQPNPPLTATYSGFVGAETAADLTGALSLATAAGALSPPGAYAIVPAGLSSQNYSIRYVNGTLVVLLAPTAPPTARLGLDSALATRDARLVDLTVAKAGSSSAECRPPAADERVCVGWPVCQVPRPVCETRTTAEP